MGSCGSKPKPLETHSANQSVSPSIPERQDMAQQDEVASHAASVHYAVNLDDPRRSVEKVQAGTCKRQLDGIPNPHWTKEACDASGDCQWVLQAHLAQKSPEAGSPEAPAIVDLDGPAEIVDLDGPSQIVDLDGPAEIVDLDGPAGIVDLDAPAVADLDVPTQAKSAMRLSKTATVLSPSLKKSLAYAFEICGDDTPEPLRKAIKFALQFCDERKEHGHIKQAIAVALERVNNMSWKVAGQEAKYKTALIEALARCEESQTAYETKGEIVDLDATAEIVDLDAAAEVVDLDAAQSGTPEPASATTESVENDAVSSSPEVEAPAQESPDVVDLDAPNPGDARGSQSRPGAQVCAEKKQVSEDVAQVCARARRRRHTRDSQEGDQVRARAL